MILFVNDNNGILFLKRVGGEIIKFVVETMIKLSKMIATLTLKS